MLIEIDHIHFAYPGGVNALNGVSMVIQPGEKVALIGQNGSGKTTLARHLNGLLRPKSGRITVGDWQVAGHSPAQMARRVAYVFQNPDEQLFCQHVWEEVAFGPQNLGYTPGQVKTMVEEALDFMDLKIFQHLNPRDLGYSGRKRVALASALAMRTPVVILDEPTAGFDAREQEMLTQMISTLHQQGKTMLVISHDMNFIAENLDRVVLMDQGQIAMDAPVQYFFEQIEMLNHHGIISPQITRLSQYVGRPRCDLTVEQFLEGGGS